MPTRPTATDPPGARPPAGPMHRSIVALDIEGSTERTDLVKAELRRALYEFVDQALRAAGIKTEHLEQITDRGDGVLILIRPHDDVPKTVLLNQLIPELTALLADYNATRARPEDRLRVRAVVHAGEVNYDGKGFFGGALDVAFRLLDSPRLKKRLKEAAAHPLVLVISQEIYSGTVCQALGDREAYEPFVSRRIAGRPHRGWVHIPAPHSEGPQSDPSLPWGLELGEVIAAQVTGPSRPPGQCRGNSRTRRTPGQWPAASCLASPASDGSKRGA